MHRLVISIILFLIEVVLISLLIGDYASAIETLVTAISLIKQSKVAHDERCKILVSSLQDTLHGIEAKSYGSRRGNINVYLFIFPLIYWILIVF